MINKLLRAQQGIKDVIKDLSLNPRKELVNNLIKECSRIDQEYRDLCLDIDDETGDEKGTAYKNNVSIEFIIEANHWHRVSIALEKLKKG